MIIKEIKIKNFKGFKELTIHSNPKFNVIIGENNIGKSTIFEALILWKKCFDMIVRPNRTAFYKKDTINDYIPFSELAFVRAANDTDLFNTSPNEANISIVFSIDNSDYNLTFKISKPRSISNSYLRFTTLNHAGFDRFAETLKRKNIKLDEALFIYQTRPISNIIRNEPFMNNGQILKKIAIGKSGDVLRNKIIRKQRASIDALANKVSDVLGYNILFIYKNESRRDSDEYIDLKVSQNSKELDLHLQGSGLLQVTEIFSTIDFLSNNALNILLIDEPDSHIHVKLQKKLLTHIKSTNNTQSFVISHNDNFVGEVDEGELFYLNNQVKAQKELNPLVLHDFDKIKKELGGIIVSLDKLNSTDKICFVEGDDDKEYINNLLLKYLALAPQTVSSNPVFFYIRGKDNLIKKLEFYKRLLNQIFRDKKMYVIYDKDYCTIAGSNNFESQIRKTLVQDFGGIVRHDGYCIESTLFSEPEKLIHLLALLSNISENEAHIFIDEYQNRLIADMKDITSNKHKEYRSKFDSQKTSSRTELNGIEFGDYISCATNNPPHPQYFFNKHEIKSFIIEFEHQFFVELFPKTDDDSPEFYASSIFNIYIDKITCINDFYTSNIEMLRLLYGFV